MAKRYRLYIDESGDHTFENLDSSPKRYLGILGCFIEAEYYRGAFQPKLEQLKQKFFPHSPDEPMILHRREIIDKSGRFWRLRDPEVEKNFNNDLLKFFEATDYKVVAVVIDKKSHIERYQAAAFHPYHYCIAALLERYCGFLNFCNAVGDVLAEQRGGKEDMQLKEAYRRTYESGTTQRGSEFFQKSLTSKEIKIKPKSANIAGLQLADLLAYPCKNEILFENDRITDQDWQSQKFSQEICKCLSEKYNRHIFNGRISGYGKVFLE
jgi:hypothetical protein